MAAKQPDMRFDIDALFEHMTTNLGHELDQEKQWDFSLRSTSLAKLEHVAGKLVDEFDVQIQEVVETIEADGTSSMGPPLLTVGIVGALQPTDVKALAARLRKMASDEGVEYDGVSCYDPINEEELFGWLGLEDAQWRLRHHTDCGLAENAAMLYLFAVAVEDDAHADKVLKSLTKAGFRKAEVSDDEEDAEGEESYEEDQATVLVTIKGKNNDDELAAAFARAEKAAAAAGGELLGVQFPDDDGNDEEDEEE